jgi:hypothetical protein
MRPQWGLVVGGFAVYAALTGSVALAQGLSADEILTRVLAQNRQRLAALESYTTERTYRVQYDGTGGHHAGEIRVKVEYSAPEQKKMTLLEESGSKVICDRVLKKLVEGEVEASDKANRMQTALTAENYAAELEGEETLYGVRAWVLKVNPKVDNKFTYRGQVWVSEDDYAVMRVAGEPAKSPSWWINKASFDSRYMRRGDVWVPQSNVSKSHVRIGGEATLTIDYGEYQELAAKPLKQDGVKVASAAGHEVESRLKAAVVEKTTVATR